MSYENITIGVEQEFIGFEVVSKKTSNLQKYFATIKYKNEENGVICDCVYITGDTCTHSDQEYCYQTLELSTYPIQKSDEEVKKMTKYVLQEFYRTIKSITMCGSKKVVRFEDIKIKNFKNENANYSFIIENNQKDIDWYINRNSQQIKFANQITVGMNFQQFINYIDTTNPNIPQWIRKPLNTSQSQKSIVLNYVQSMVLKASKIIVLQEWDKINDDNNTLKTIVDAFIKDLNHADIKNKWNILPRTPLYRAIEQAKIELHEINDIIIDKTENIKYDSVATVLLKEFKKQYNENKKTADQCLHAGIKDSNIEIDKTVYLFELRSVNSEIQLFNDLSIKTTDYLLKDDDINCQCL